MNCGREGCGKPKTWHLGLGGMGICSPGFKSTGEMTRTDETTGGFIIPGSSRSEVRRVAAQVGLPAPDFTDPEQDPWAKDEGISDLQMLEAIRKGSFWLKLKKLRALGFISGRMPLQLLLTQDGAEEIQRITKEPFFRARFSPTEKTLAPVPAVEVPTPPGSAARTKSRSRRKR